MTLALSTSWFLPGEGILDTIRHAAAMGIREFEVGVTDEPLPVDELEARVRAGEVRFVSVHNLCPRKRVLGKNARGEFLGHTSPMKRRETVKKTLETIDVARRLRAPTVVVHLGEARIRSAPRRQAHLARYVCQLGRTSELSAELQRLLLQRREVALRAMDAVRASLREIFDRAPDIVLGVENRYYYHQIPLPDEMEELLRDFSAPRLTYWHDTGHANALDLLGLVPHSLWLDRFAARMGGIHLHDVVEFFDHLPPGAGHLDFAAFRDRIPPAAVRVVEVHEGYSVERMAKAKGFLERQGIAV